MLFKATCETIALFHRCSGVRNGRACLANIDRRLGFRELAVLREGTTIIDRVHTLTIKPTDRRKILSRLRDKREGDETADNLGIAGVKDGRGVPNRVQISKKNFHARDEVP